MLSQHPGVRECVVPARDAGGVDDSAGAAATGAADRRIVAYVVPHGPSAPGAEQLRAHLAETLPAFMVPSAFMTLKALPLTKNGKLDRSSLPAPEPMKTGAEARGAAPRSPVEEVIAGIWAEVLGLPRVGVRRQLFRSGGALAAGHAGHLPGAERVPRARHPECAVRRSDRRRPGGGSRAGAASGAGPGGLRR